jgi:hypothetical protein
MKPLTGEEWEQFEKAKNASYANLTSVRLIKIYDTMTAWLVAILHRSARNAVFSWRTHPLTQCSYTA